MIGLFPLFYCIILYYHYTEIWKAMLMKYPKGTRPGRQNRSGAGRRKDGEVRYGSRGMTLEKDLDFANSYYLEHGRAVIHKKPTPVQIVNVDYPSRNKAK